MLFQLVVAELPLSGNPVKAMVPSISLIWAMQVLHSVCCYSIVCVCTVLSVSIVTVYTHVHKYNIAMSAVLRSNNMCSS